MGLNRNLGQLTEVIKELNGNIGIATTTPDALFTVNKTNTNYTDASAGHILLDNSSSIGQSSIYYRINGTVRGKIRVDQLGTMNYIANGNGHDFWTGGDAGTGSTKMTITPSGNVGIGTDTSGYGAGKLVVMSNGVGNTGMSLDNTSSGDFTTSLFLYGNGDLKCRFDYDKFASRGIMGTVANIPQTFWTNNTERMRIFSNGNTYIGPSASDTGARLQLEGSNDILSLRSTDAATRSTMALITNGYDWEVGARGSASNPANSFYIYNIDTSSYRFIIGSSGNVIIGKSSDDGQKLQVSGGVTIDSGSARGLRIDTNNGVQGLSLSPNSVFGIDEPGIGNGRFVINNSGQVGIGTNSPVGKVHSMGPMVISNYAGTFRRAMTVHGATGAFSQVKVIFNKTNWGSVTYDIKLASAGGSYHTAGAYYSNPGFSSHLTSINSGWGISMSLTAASPTGGTQGATWTFSGATMIHPSLTVDISCGFGYQVDPNDIIVEYT